MTAGSPLEEEKDERSHKMMEALEIKIKALTCLLACLSLQASSLNPKQRRGMFFCVFAFVICCIKCCIFIEPEELSGKELKRISVQCN